MKTKKHRIIIPLIIFLIFVAGVVWHIVQPFHDNSTTDNTDITQTILYPAYSQLVQHTEYNKDRFGVDADNSIIYNNTFDYNFIRDNKLYSISKIWDNTGRHYYLSTLDIASGENILPEKMLGNIGTFFEYENGFIEIVDGKLVMYDGEFENVRETNLKDIYSQIENFDNDVIWKQALVDADGNIGLVSDNMIVVFDAVENKLCGIVESNSMEFTRAVVTDSGKWYTFCWNKGGQELYSLDISNGIVQDKLDVFPEIIANVYQTGKNGDDDFYFVTNKKIYEYTADMQTCREVFSMNDYGIDTDDDTAVSIVSQDKIYIVNEMDAYKNDDFWDVQMELAVIDRVNTADIKERTQLVMAIFNDLNFSDKYYLLNFNKYNKDYYITTKVYDNDAAAEYSVKKQNFYNDIITGKGADLFWVSNNMFDIAELGKKGIAQDLYEFMNVDEELTADKFIPSVLKNMEYDGKLYAISPSFDMMTLVGKSEMLEGYDNWDFNAMYDLYEKYPDADILGGVSRDIALFYFMQFSLDLFYDRDTGECHFADEEFVKLLEMLSKLPQNVSYEIPLGEQIKNDKILLYPDIFSCSSIRQLCKYYEGYDISYVGFPSENNSGVALKFNDYIVVNRQSENNEGAWEFVKSMLVDDVKTIKDNYSVIQSKFDKRIQLETQERSVKSSTMDMYGTSIDEVPLTSEQVQLFYELVNSSTQKNMYDEDVYNIVYEEAQSFFSGVRDAKETADIIQNRVQLYLEEKN